MGMTGPMGAMWPQFPVDLPPLKGWPNCDTGIRWMQLSLAQRFTPPWAEWWKRRSAARRVGRFKGANMEQLMDSRGTWAAIWTYKAT